MLACVANTILNLLTASAVLGKIGGIMCNQDWSQEHYQGELKCWACKPSHQPRYPVIGRSCFGLWISCFCEVAKWSISNILFWPQWNLSELSEEIEVWESELDKICWGSLVVGKWECGNVNLAKFYKQAKFTINPNSGFLCILANRDHLTPVTVLVVIVLVISLKFISAVVDLVRSTEVFWGEVWKYVVKFV